MFPASSDPSRLYESMKMMSTPQRNRYCAKHWPSPTAAHENLLEMSKYFLDANEMVMYASK